MLPRSAVATAATLYCIEAFVLQTYIATFLIIAIATFTGLMKLVFRRDAWAPIFSTVAVCWMAYACACGSIAFNNRISRERALRIASAVREYKNARGHYPEALSDLVPDFLPSIPVARYTLFLNQFFYWSRPDRARVMYVQLPLFGRPYLRVENGTWGYLD